MMACLAENWRYWESGCRPVDYKAGDILEDPQAIACAEACGVLEKTKPETEAPKTRKKK